MSPLIKIYLGTGKSLSLLCAAVTWLKDNEIRVKRELEQSLAEEKRQLCDCQADDDWLKAYDKQLVIEQRLRGERNNTVVK